MRCYWPAKYMDARVVTMDEWNKLCPDVPEHDVYVFQKLANAGQMRALKTLGKRVIWDVCDPSWWFQPEEARAVANEAEVIVASNAGLAEDFSAWAGKPCAVIPDRMELQHFDKQREHADETPVRLIWFGVSVNRLCLWAAYANLARLRANGHDVSLTVMDNSPKHGIGFEELPTSCVRWSLETEVEVLAQHDIALLPPYPGPWAGVKSNNKTLTAWACGLPVTQGVDYAELEALVVSVELRRAQGAKGRREVEQLYQAERSAKEWELLHVR
jgi:hypothetical protein